MLGACSAIPPPMAAPLAAAAAAAAILHPRRRFAAQTLTCRHGDLHLAATTRRIRLAAAAAAADEDEPGIPMAEIVERDYSFLDPFPSNAAWFRNARRAIAAAEIRPGSRIAAAFPTPAFIDLLVADPSPCELIVAFHESLMVLAAIKESHDAVRCWQGRADAVPEGFGDFDAFIVCYFPGLEMPIGDALSSIAARCSPGAKLVISYVGGGREAAEAEHRRRFPETAGAGVPGRDGLEKAAAEHSFRVEEVSDENDFYLAVLSRRS